MNNLDLVQNLKTLRLPTFAEEYGITAKECEAESKTHEQFLAILCEAELEARKILKTKQLISQAKMPRQKKIADFDFSAVKGVTRTLINELMTGQFLKDGKNIVIYGNFGVGKSHLAEGLVYALCENGYRCKYSSVSELIDDLAFAHKDLSLAKYLKKTDRYDLIVLDELGYLTFTQDKADLLFQLISHRTERRSLLITTNLPYSEWDKVFSNPLTAKGAIDRLIYNCENINMSADESWRAKKAKKQAQSSLKS